MDWLSYCTLSPFTLSMSNGDYSIGRLKRCPFWRLRQEGSRKSSSRTCLAALGLCPISRDDLWQQLLPLTLDPIFRPFRWAIGIKPDQLRQCSRTVERRGHRSRRKRWHRGCRLAPSWKCCEWLALILPHILRKVRGLWCWWSWA